MDNKSFVRDRVKAPKNLPGNVWEAARQVIQGLEAGKPLQELRGQRLNYDRKVISFPVGYRYRLLAFDTGGRIAPTELLSHEAYNKHRK